MMLCGKMLPCQSREAFVTVTSYRSGIMDAYLQHPRLEGKAVRIQSLAQLILMLDALLDMEHCPGSPLPLVAGEEGGSRMAAFYHGTDSGEFGPIPEQRSDAGAGQQILCEGCAHGRP